MDLIREILLTVESHSHGFAPQEIKIAGYSEDQIAYHSYLIGDAGLAVTADTTDLESTGPEALIKHLTSAGQWIPATCLLRDYFLGRQLSKSARRNHQDLGDRAGRVHSMSTWVALPSNGSG